MKINLSKCKGCYHLGRMCRVPVQRIITKCDGWIPADCLVIKDERQIPWRRDILVLPADPPRGCMTISDERQILQFPKLRCTTCGRLINMTTEHWPGNCDCHTRPGEKVVITECPKGCLMVVDESDDKNLQ